MKTAVITGSASGIGAAVHRQFADAGMNVIGVDIARADVCADLSNAAGRAAALDAVLARSGGAIDTLVCCAGLGPQAEPATLVASVNYFGSLALLDGLFEALKRGSQPAAVVVSSNSAVLQPWSGHPLHEAFLDGDEARVHALVEASPADQAGYLAYASSKHALAVAARRRADSWGSAGVRLNVVAPGAVQTPLLEAGLRDARYGEAIRQFVPPVGRRAEPGEIASLIHYVCGEQVGFMHGSVLFIDGGHDAKVRPDAF
ncbi:3-alpha-hydroxysteroid dehydrogenase/carbonyl reductase [Paraburkholderia caffeinitolerans]|uniref:3-alpha-hydroxysteroid dehydrogenase/carbonyl reductase n=1 Tax=Paraburkholderia caffeinitolerans TaxID=1723730 RepID=A0A6J5FDB6_9BURK|nr:MULTISPECIES: SDR family oxidoreductase [Paraburkholderia]CAB3777791.1 3-alpha-hydroxysteroid dehydrogenase/carbonyl reductase [Paraburkholderia caffeinitolerans]